MEVNFDESDSAAMLSTDKDLYIAEPIEPFFESRRIIDVSTAERSLRLHTQYLSHGADLVPESVSLVKRRVVRRPSQFRPPPLPPSRHYLPSPSNNPAKQSDMDQRYSLRNDAMLPGYFLALFFDDDGPEASDEEDPSQKLMREASQLRRSQRAVAHKDYVSSNCTSGEKRARSPGRLDALNFMLRTFDTPPKLFTTVCSQRSQVGIPI